MARARVRGNGGNDGEGPTGETRTEGAGDALDAALDAYVSETAPALSKGDALQMLSKASVDALKLDERQLQDRYDIGETLVLFASRRGHVALGYRRLGPCLRERFKLGRSWAYASMRLAKVATRGDLGGLNWTVAELGMQLADLMEVESFEALRKKPLPVPSVDGDAVHFPAPPDVLEKAIEELERKPAPAPADEDEARAVERAALRRAQTLLDEHLERYPALAEASPSVFIRDGVAQLRLGSSIELRAETLSAVTRFVVALDKAFRRG